MNFISITFDNLLKMVSFPAREENLKTLQTFVKIKNPLGAVQ